MIARKQLKSVVYKGRDWFFVKPNYHLLEHVTGKNHLLVHVTGKKHLLVHVTGKNLFTCYMYQ